MDNLGLLSSEHVMCVLYWLLSSVSTFLFFKRMGREGAKDHGILQFVPVVTRTLRFSFEQATYFLPNPSLCGLAL